MKFARFVSLPLMLLLLACQSPPSGNEEKIIQLRFGHDMPVDSAQHRGALRFAELLASRSGQQVQVEVFPNRALGSDHEMMEMARNGDLDIILPPTAKLSTIVNSMQILDLPYLFDSAEQAYQIMDGHAGQLLLAKLASRGLVGLSFWESGFKQLSSNRAIRKADDLSGLRFRIMPSDILRDQFTAWGASVRNIAFGKTRKALVDKVVDGQENPLNTIFSMKFHEAQSHLILSNHGYLAQVLAMSQKSYDRLPMEVQNMIVDVAKDVTDFQRVESKKIERDVLKKIAENTEVYELPLEQKAILRQRTAHLLEKNRFLLGTELVEHFLQARDELNPAADNELIIGVDADLAGNSALSGLSIRRGIEMALDEINQAGGVLGKRLRVMARDNSMVSARGKQNIQYFSKIPQLVAVFAGISSPVALAELELVHQHKILFLDPWAAATGIVENGYEPNYVFRVSVRDADAAGFLVPKALEVSDKIGLLLPNNGWGRSNHKGMLAALEKNGKEPVAIQWFDWGESRYQQKLQTLRERGAEVLIFVGNTVEGAKMVKQIHEMSLNLPIISHWGITGGDFVGNAGKGLEEVDLRVLQTFSFINNEEKRVKRFVKRYQQRYFASSAEGIVAPTGTAHAYDLTHMLARAIVMAGSADMSKIRVAMEKLGRYRGLVRNYNPPFSKKDHDALDASDFFLARYQRGVLVPERKR